MVLIIVDEPHRLRIAEDAVAFVSAGRGDVAIRVLRARICGSDTPILHGSNPLPQVVDWLVSGRLAQAAMIARTFAARDARQAFDLVERHPERTMKVHLDLAG